jgi:hypothetical protein
MLPLRYLLCVLLLAPSCTATVPSPDEDPETAALEDRGTPLDRGPCTTLMGPPGFRIVEPEPRLQFWIDKGDPPPGVKPGAAAR